HPDHGRDAGEPHAKATGVAQGIRARSQEQQPGIGGLLRPGPRLLGRGRGVGATRITPPPRWGGGPSKTRPGGGLRDVRCIPPPPTSPHVGGGVLCQLPVSSPLFTTTPALLLPGEEASAAAHRNGR